MQDDRSNAAALAELKGKTFPVLGGQGWVRCVDALGSDAAICRAARVTTGSAKSSPADDRRLIRSLMRRAEMSPFEFAEVVLHVRAPLYVLAQWKRYRSAHLAEYSQRYREAIDEAHETPPDGWRKQGGTRQGSAGAVTEWPPGYAVEECYSGDWDDENDVADGELVSITDPETGKSLGFTVFTDGETPTPGGYLTRHEKELHDSARHVYAERLKFGVAREQARTCLPVATLSEMYFKVDLRNLLHLLKERLGHAAQSEFAEYARVIGAEIVEPLFPETHEAFTDYILGAVTLTRLEAEAAWEIGRRDPSIWSPDEAFRNGCAAAGWPVKGACSERDEARAKLIRIGLLT